MTTATPLRPQLHFFELRKTASIAGRIPALPPDLRDDSFQMRSMLGQMRLQHQSQAMFNSKNAEQEARTQAASIQSGVPLPHVRALMGETP